MDESLDGFSSYVGAGGRTSCAKRVVYVICLAGVDVEAQTTFVKRREEICRIGAREEVIVVKYPMEESGMWSAILVDGVANSGVAE